MAFNLTIDDFQFNEQKTEATVVWINPDFAEKLKAAGNLNKNANSDALLRTCTSKVRIENSNIEITFNPDEITHADKFIKIINKNLDWVSSNLNEIKSHIAKNMIKLKNNTWLEENEGELSTDDFINKLNKIESITFNNDSSFEIYFNDNELFWGHVINLPVTNTLKMKKPGIEG